jgi:hypothetical protein
MRPIATILDDIAAFRPAAADNWRPLDQLFIELFDRDDNLQSAIEPLLAVLERFARHDGHGVLWTVIHGLEHAGGYERALVRSVQRAPTALTITMVQRLINDGVSRIDGVDLEALIAEAEPRAPEIDHVVD